MRHEDDRVPRDDKLALELRHLGTRVEERPRGFDVCDDFGTIREPNRPGGVPHLHTLEVAAQKLLAVRAAERMGGANGRQPEERTQLAEMIRRCRDGDEAAS